MQKHLKGQKNVDSSENYFGVRPDKKDETSITDLAKKQLSKSLNDDIDHIEIRKGWKFGWSFHTSDKTTLARGLITNDHLDLTLAIQKVKWYRIAMALAAIAGLISAFQFF
jgi:hypothetical protein